MTPDPRKMRLSVVLVQYEVEGKYPNAVPKLLAVLDRLGSTDAGLVLVDNGREGEWEHRVSERIVQVGGDNRAWEFSGFDRGLETLDRWRPEADLTVLVTDAFQAYGEEFLELIDDRALECAVRLDACFGWMDSFGLQECRIGELAYDTWVRSSFVLLPPRALLVARPLATDLERLGLFSGDPRVPFSETAELSQNLRLFLTEWLTTLEIDEPQLAEHWHSRFDLSADTMPLFQAKVGSILREHLLSARLKDAEIACYDYRCLPLLADEGRLERFMETGGSPELEWLGWRSPPPEWRGERKAAGSSVGSGLGGPCLLLAGEVGRSQSPEAAGFLADRVLPLIRQRHAGVFLIVAGNACDLPGTGGGGESVLLRPSLSDLSGSELLDACAAIVAPPGSNPGCVEATTDRIDKPLPLVVWKGAAEASSAARVRLEADSATEIAAACSRLIERGRPATVAGPPDSGCGSRT